MILYLLCYLVMGIIAIIGYSIIFTFKLYKRGYDLEAVTSVISDALKDEEHLIFNVIIGIFIWPIRIYDAVYNEHGLCKTIEHYMNESK